MKIGGTIALLAATTLVWGSSKVPTEMPEPDQRPLQWPVYTVSQTAERTDSQQAWAVPRPVPRPGEVSAPVPARAQTGGPAAQPRDVPDGYRWHDGQWWFQVRDEGWRYWADGRWNRPAGSAAAPNVQAGHTSRGFSTYRGSTDWDDARARPEIRYNDHLGYGEQRTTRYRSPHSLYDRRYAHTPYYDRDFGFPYRGHSYGYPYRDVGYGIEGYHGAIHNERGFPTYGYSFGYPGYGSTFRGGYFDTGRILGSPGGDR